MSYVTEFPVFFANIETNVLIFCLPLDSRYSWTPRIITSIFIPLLYCDFVCHQGKEDGNRLHACLLGRAEFTFLLSRRIEDM